MVEVPSVPSPTNPNPRRRRTGRPSIDTDLLRVQRLNVQFNSDELQVCHRAAQAAALPLGRWARRALLGTPTPAAQPTELRALWSSSSTLQSNTNQLVERLNQLHLSGDLSRDSADQTLRELAVLAPRLYSLVKQMRVELLSVRSSAGRR